MDDEEEFAAVAKEVSDDPGSAERGGSYPTLYWGGAVYFWNTDQQLPRAF